jgi:hypothetical protein
MNQVIPIGTFARLVAARARRALSTKVQRPAATPAANACAGSCAHVPDQVWSALEAVYPRFALEGPGCRQALAALFAPVMAAQGWRFCRCYHRTGLAEHRFICHLVNIPAANAAADALKEEGAL